MFISFGGEGFEVDLVEKVGVEEKGGGKEEMTR
jgi:hypothetical protein